MAKRFINFHPEALLSSRKMHKILQVVKNLLWKVSPTYESMEKLKITKMTKLSKQDQYQKHRTLDFHVKSKNVTIGQRIMKKMTKYYFRFLTTYQIDEKNLFIFRENKGSVSTVWKFKNFSVNQILCEINFRKSKSLKNVIWAWNSN